LKIESWTGFAGGVIVDRLRRGDVDRLRREDVDRLRRGEVNRLRRMS
jgi:hypothetical protein